MWLNDHIAAALSVMAAAAADTVLNLTAEYVKGRVQFERPLASFQAVSQRTADAYIDTEAMKLTAWQAAWRLSEELPAHEHVATAKFWAAEGGHRRAARRPPPPRRHGRRSRLPAPSLLPSTTSNSSCSLARPPPRCCGSGAAILADTPVP